MYADFPYYQDVFKGILITDEAMFRTFSERASEFLDTATFDRLADEELLNCHKIKIQKCVCALAEMFFKRNIALNGVLNHDNMPETIGAYSVSKANPYDYVHEVSINKEATDRFATYVLMPACVIGIEPPHCRSLINQNKLK